MLQFIGCALFHWCRTPTPSCLSNGKSSRTCRDHPHRSRSFWFSVRTFAALPPKPMFAKMCSSSAETLLWDTCGRQLLTWPTVCTSFAHFDLFNRHPCTLISPFCVVCVCVCVQSFEFQWHKKPPFSPFKLASFRTALQTSSHFLRYSKPS